MNLDTGAALVGALEGVYRAVRARCPELPAVVFVTGSGRSGSALKWGHCAHGRWSTADGARSEVFVSGECLAQGAIWTLQTILHEAAHLLAAARGVQDTSRQGRYHNRAFLGLARELGLEWPGGPPSSSGFSSVELTAATEQAYTCELESLNEAILAHIDVSLPAGRPGGEGGRTGERSRGGRSLMRFACECEPPRVLRMAPTVWETASVTCGACGADFA